MSESSPASFTVVIPTYRRPRELGECLSSIISQSALPGEVLVIDDDSLPEPFVAGWRERFRQKSVTLTYRRKDHAVERRGLSESKNVALQEAKGDVVFFFDDDVVLDPGFLEAVMKVWDREGGDPRLMGVGGLIRNARRAGTLEKAYNSLFGLRSPLAWDVTDIGYVVWDEGLRETSRAYYLHGGVSSLRRKEALRLRFALFSGGRTGLEDIDFCLTAKKAGCHFVMVPAATVLHNHSDVSCESEFLIGLKDGVNRRDIFRRLGPATALGRLWFGWASAGWVLKHLLGLRWRRAAGQAWGFSGFSRPA